MSGYFSFSQSLARNLLLAVLLLSQTACGSSRPHARSGSKTAAEKAKPLPRPGEFYTAGLAAYASDTPLPADRTEDKLRFRLRPTLKIPPALHCYAREYAARFGSDQADPDHGTAQAIAHHCGYWARPRNHYSITAPNYEALIQHVSKLPKSSFEGMVAVGTALHPNGAITATLVTSRTAVHLAPVPRSGAAELAGRLVRGEGQVELWLSDDAGPKRLEFEIDLMGRFKVNLPATPELRRIELTTSRGRFKETIALLHLGLPRAAASFDLPQSGSPPGSEPQKILHWVNTVRRQRNLPPLELEPRLNSRLDDWLSRVANETAEDTPPGILDDNGWQYARLEYGLTSGASAAQAVQLLFNTPTGEKLLTDPSMSELSVGIRKFRENQGFDAVILTLAPFKQLAAGQVREAVTTRLNSQREGLGLPPLTLAPELNKVAQRQVEAVVASGMPWEEALQTLLADVSNARIVRGRFGGGGLTAIHPRDAKFTAEDAALSKDVKLIGIGTVGGPMPNGGQPRYILLYVVAEARAGSG